MSWVGRGHREKPPKTRGRRRRHGHCTEGECLGTERVRSGLFLPAPTSSSFFASFAGPRFRRRSFSTNSCPQSSRRLALPRGRRLTCAPVGRGLSKTTLTARFACSSLPARLSPASTHFISCLGFSSFFSLASSLSLRLSRFVSLASSPDFARCCLADSSLRLRRLGFVLRLPRFARDAFVSPGRVASPDSCLGS